MSYTHYSHSAQQYQEGKQGHVSRVDERPIKVISTLQEAAVAMGVLPDASEIIPIDLERPWVQVKPANAR